MDQEVVYTAVVLLFLSDVPVSSCCKPSMNHMFGLKTFYMMFFGGSFFGEAFAVWGSY
jgi:hypothetical protein